MLLSMVLVYSTSQSLEQRNGLPFINQASSWAIVGKQHVEKEYMNVLLFPIVLIAVFSI